MVIVFYQTNQVRYHTKYEINLPIMSVNKKIIILLVTLTLVGAGIFAYIIVMKKTVAPAAPITSAREQEFNAAIKKLSATDQDFDGIPDIDEVKYQTSVTSADSDGDGLTDSQEVFTFKTNPLKADTDGDGKTDGYEVRRGTNPNKI